jgi:hypothetical protein
MSAHTETYKTDVSEIIHEAERKLGEKYEENVSLGKQSLIKEFLDAVVSSGELTEINRQRIEENPDLKEWFPQPTEMDTDMDSTEGEEDEEDEVFRGRTTFPEEKCEQTNDFIVDYIEQEWPDLNVTEPDREHPLWRHDEKRYIIYRYSVDGVVLCSRGANAPPLRRTTLILHSRPSTNLPPTPARKIKKGIFEGNLHGTISGTYSDGIPYQRDLRGKKFKELDELLCIL